MPGSQAADGSAVRESAARNGWSPPGDWLARNSDASDFNLKASAESKVGDSVLADLIREPPASLSHALARVAADLKAEPGDSAARNGPRRSKSSGSRPRSSSQCPVSEPSAQLATPGAPSAPAQAAPVDAPAPRSVRPLLLSRTRLPIAGTGAVAWRRPAPTSPSVAASVAAGAIASGRSLPKAPVPAAPVVRAHGEAAADQSLVSNMATRLAQVERLNQQQAMKLARQSQELDAVRAELNKLQQSPSAVDPAVGDERGEKVDERCNLDDLHRLRAERNQYRRQVEEMTKFLADYGLTWVGDGPAADSDADDMTSIGDDESNGHGIGAAFEGEDMRNERAGDVSTIAEKLSRPSSTIGLSSLNVNIQVMESRVRSLNAMVEKEGARIVSNRVGGAVHARLVADDALPLPLTFFQDGVKLGAHAFRTYESAGAQQLVRDILDGYFPYALKDEHPDGVAMKVLDRTHQTFQEWLRNHASSDPDLLDGGDRLLPDGGRVLHHARAGARQRSAAADNHAATSGDGLSSARDLDLLEPDRASTAPFARLQVKLEGGERLVLRMELSHTVGDLEDALARWRAETGTASPESVDGKRLLLRTAFPPRSYVDRAQSLEEAGLAPSATLFVGAAEDAEAQLSPNRG